MTDEQIKDIVVAMIDNDELYLGASNEEAARAVALFINTLKQSINN